MRRQLFTLLLAVPLTAGAQIFSVSSERTVALPDSTSQVAAISPRGDFLLLTDAENNGLRKYDLTTGAITPITTASGAGYGVELSADGTKAVYREITYDQHHLRYTSLHVADLSGGKSRQVVKPTRSLQGYSVDDEEYVEGLYCMAAPVRSSSGQIVAAMSVAVPLLGRGTQFRRKRESILPRLIAAANGVSAALGWRGQVFS